MVMFMINIMSCWDRSHGLSPIGLVTSFLMPTLAKMKNPPFGPRSESLLAIAQSGQLPCFEGAGECKPFMFMGIPCALKARYGQRVTRKRVIPALFSVLSKSVSTIDVGFDECFLCLCPPILSKPLRNHRHLLPEIESF